MTIKTHYSAPELAEMNLIGLPKYPQKINARAKKESWVGRQRKVGKGLEYEVKSLPVHIREQIKEHVIGKLVEASQARKVIVAENQTVIMLETVRRCPAVLEKKLADLNESLVLQEWWAQDVAKSMKKKGTVGAFTAQCQDMGFKKSSGACIKHVEEEYVKVKTDFEAGKISESPRPEGRGFQLMHLCT